MVFRIVYAVFTLLTLIISSDAYARCSDITYCYPDPVTNARVCKTLKNFCSIIPDAAKATDGTQTDEGSSIQINGLSDEQIKKVLDTIGIDTRRVMSR